MPKIKVARKSQIMRRLVTKKAVPTKEKVAGHESYARLTQGVYNQALVRERVFKETWENVKRKAEEARSNE